MSAKSVYNIAMKNFDYKNVVKEEEINDSSSSSVRNILHIDSSQTDTEASSGNIPNGINNIKGKLRRFEAIAIIIGIIVGSGIFSSPGLALSRCGGSPGEVLIAWTVSGVLVILTGLCYIE